MNDLYQEIILEEARHPQNQGILEEADAVVHERNASCGDEVTLYVKLDVDKKITALKWTGHGCIISQAATSVTTSKVLAEGLTLDQIKHLGKTDIEALLGIEEISPGRLKCLLLGLQALKTISLT